jgi:hypothetical protein
MTVRQYNRYKKGAKWYGATGHTGMALLGMVQRKDAQVEVADGFKPMLDDVTLAGVDLDAMLSRVVRNQVGLGRYGVWVDFSDEQGLPYMRGFEAGQIVNWATRMVRGRRALSLVVLKDTENSVGRFAIQQTPIYRVLELDEDGRYQVSIWRDDGRGVFTEEDIFEPTILGQRLGFIPFQFFGSTDLDAGVDKSPLEDLMRVNLHHYLLSGDHAWGLHFVALPTPYRIGTAGQKNLPTGLGPSVIWDLPKGAEVGMLEYEGKGLSDIASAMDADKQEMASLGARLIMGHDAGVEAAETVRLKASQESSVLSNVAKVASAGMTNVLRWMHQWLDLPDSEVMVQVNTDFHPIKMEPAMIRELVAALQAGSISYDTFFANLKAGELVPEDRTAEDEQDMIDFDGPSFGGGDGGGQGGFTGGQQGPVGSAADQDTGGVPA